MGVSKLSKKAKKEILLDIIQQSGVVSQTDPLAIFAAGIPGAGKTEFLNELPSLQEEFVRIDLDGMVKHIPGYEPESYYDYRSVGNAIVDDLVRYCRKHSLNFVLDGTLGHKYAVDNIRKTLKTHEVVVLGVWKDPAESWQLTKDRELITRRAIDRDGFIASCIKVPMNLRTIRDDFKDKVMMIIISKYGKNEQFKVLREDGEIDQLLSKTYTKEELEKVIL